MKYLFIYFSDTEVLWIAADEPREAMDSCRHHNEQHGGCEGEFQSTHQPFGRKGGAT